VSEALKQRSRASSRFSMMMKLVPLGIADAR
jgi:hypothetical protein